jgi:hypothetical protein
VDGDVVLVGLISDTHGRMRDGALAALRGCDLIVHAGDVGGRHVLDALAAIAPVHAVCGNTDLLDDPALEGRREIEILGRRLHVSHGHELGAPTPAKLAARYDADIIVFGHTHEPVIARIGRTLIVNPGSAGPPRFRLPVSVAILRVTPGEVGAEIVEIAT